MGLWAYIFWTPVFIIASLMIGTIILETGIISETAVLCFIAFFWLANIVTAIISFISYLIAKHKGDGTLDIIWRGIFLCKHKKEEVQDTTSTLPIKNDCTEQQSTPISTPINENTTDTQKSEVELQPVPVSMPADKPITDTQDSKLEQQSIPMSALIDRYVATPQKPTAGKNMGQVIIKRGKALGYLLRSVDIFVDGSMHYCLDNGKTLYLDLPNGMHTIEFQFGKKSHGVYQVNIMNEYDVLVNYELTSDGDGKVSITHRSNEPISNNSYIPQPTYSQPPSKTKLSGVGCLAELLLFILFIILIVYILTHIHPELIIYFKFIPVK